MDPRTVRAGHGWTWITQGYALFRKSPLNWLAIVVMLLAGTKLLAVVSWVLGVVAVLLMPVFIVGLMEGCRALERGEPLQFGHLACGFRRNASQLVTIGGISLVGNLGVMMLIISLGGDAMSTMTSAFAKGAPVTPSPEVQAASVEVARALLVGTLVSLPLLMALWYAPLLVYFHDLKPLAAMRSSLRACAKNAAAMLVYGLLIFAGMFIAMPFAMALRQYDVALWLLAPVVLPSLYASYKDIFLAGGAPQPDAAPTA